MLACNKTITHVRHIKTANGDTYECTPIVNASWFSKLKTAVLDRGTREQRYTYVRFPRIPDGLKISAGDYIVNGIVDEIEKESDLEGLEYFTVLDIADNTRGGGVSLPHWSVVGR